MLAILRLGHEAYGASILREIEVRTDRRVALGAIYKTLERLESKGLLDSWIGEPSTKRGGRRRKHYRLLDAGRLALDRTLADLRGLTQGLEAQLRVP